MYHFSMSRDLNKFKCKLLVGSLPLNCANYFANNLFSIKYGRGTPSQQKNVPDLSIDLGAILIHATHQAAMLS